MRVLHLTRDLPPRCTGGLSSAVGGAVQALRAAGTRCAVASFDGWRPARAAHAAAPQEDGDVLRLHAAAPELLAAFAQRFAPDVLHVHDAMLADAALELRQLLERPLVATIHLLQCELQRLRQSDVETRSLTGEKRLMARADLLLAPSRWAAERLAVSYSVGARLRVAGFGVDEVALPRPPPAAPVLLYAGRFGDAKGTDVLWAALPPLLAALPQLRLVLAGGLPESPSRDRRWRRRLHELVGDDARVEVAGWLSATELEECYRRASAVVVPSRVESFGLTALEAAARALPVAAANAGALPELVRHGETGVLFAPGDPAALCAAVSDLFAKDLTTLGRTAAAAVRHERLWPKVLPAWRGAYEAACA